MTLLPRNYEGTEGVDSSEVPKSDMAHESEGSLIENRDGRQHIVSLRREKQQGELDQWKKSCSMKHMSADLNTHLVCVGLAVDNDMCW
jgi:hypothetical protein